MIVESIKVFHKAYFCPSHPQSYGTLVRAHEQSLIIGVKSNAHFVQVALVYHNSVISEFHTEHIRSSQRSFWAVIIYLCF